MQEISVIIPVYNCAGTLEKTLASVRNQTFTDFELILVDDGSTDDSGKICNEYALHDKRAIVIHQYNGGVSMARNRGIKESHGRYIVFMDSDDIIGTDYLCSLYESKCSRGVTVGGFYECENGNTKLSVDYGVGEFSISNGNLFDISLNHALLSHPSPFAKIFDGNLIRSNGILFDKDVSLCEDLLFWMEYICYAEIVRLIPPVNYMYLKDNSFLTKKKHSFASYCRLSDEYLRLTESFAARFDHYPATIALEYGATLIMNSITALYNNALPRKQRISALRNIRSKHKSLLFHSYCGKTFVMKVKKFLFLTCIPLFDACQSLK